MTAVAQDTLEVRVMVTEAWDSVRLDVSPEMTVAAVKAQALARALDRPVDAPAYEVKFRGALVRDEGQTLSALGVPNHGALLVQYARRRPVR